MFLGFELSQDEQDIVLASYDNSYAKIALLNAADGSIKHFKNFTGMKQITSVGKFLDTRFLTLNLAFTDDYIYLGGIQEFDVEMQEAGIAILNRADLTFHSQYLFL